MSAGSEAVEALARAARIAHETLKDKALAGMVYADLLGIAPDHPDALQFSTEVAIEAGDQVRALPLLESLEIHQKVRDLDDFDTQVEVALYYHRFGNALLAAGRTTDAVTRFERSLALNPAYVSTLEAIGPLYIATADWKGAERVYQKLLQLTAGLGDNEQLGRVYGNLGRVEHKLGQTEKARKRLAKALELNSSDVNALRAYAEVLWDAQDWNNLLNVYNNVIYCTADRDEVVDAYIRKGHVLDIAMGFEPRAAQHYEKGLAFDPAQPDALVRLGELALRRQDWAAAADFTIRGLAVEGLGQRLRGAFLAVQAVAASGVQDASGFETFGMQAAAADAAYAGAADAETLHAAVREVLKAGPRLSG
jgi:tetratricopeptide (TPR) repeat protein